MANCKYCNKPSGFFKKFHKECEENILKNEQKFIIFSHDMNQKLNRTGHAKDVVLRIESISNKYSLTNKVRHNKNLASFIKKFFDLNTIKIDELSKIKLHFIFQLFF